LDTRLDRDVQRAHRSAMPAPQQSTSTLTTLTELRRRVPAIVERINADPLLATAAAANPILALEELGERMSPALTAAVERRVRFSREDAKRLEALSREVEQAAGRPCKLDDPAQLARVLFVDLGLRPPGARTGATGSRAKAAATPSASAAPRGSKTTSSSAEAPLSPQLVKLVEPLPPRTATEPKPAPDPLARLRSAHAVMQPLLAYRELEASQPRLASPELYGELRSGAQQLPIANLRAHLRGGTNA
jgi:hypothetical protein